MSKRLCPIKGIIDYSDVERRPEKAGRIEGRTGCKFSSPSAEEENERIKQRVYHHTFLFYRFVSMERVHRGTKRTQNIDWKVNFVVGVNTEKKYFPKSSKLGHPNTWDTSYLCVVIINKAPWTTAIIEYNKWETILMSLLTLLGTNDNSKYILLSTRSSDFHWILSNVSQTIVTHETTVLLLSALLFYRIPIRVSF